jgi:hypothetical protein
MQLAFTKLLEVVEQEPSAIAKLKTSNIFFIEIRCLFRKTKVTKEVSLQLRRDYKVMTNELLEK